MKKKLVSLFLAATMTCSMIAGATTVFAEDNAEDTTAEETVELAEPSTDEGYTIGISVLNLTGQFFIQLVDAAQNEADATGCTLMTNSCDSVLQNRLQHWKTSFQQDVMRLLYVLLILKLQNLLLQRQKKKVSQLYA